jgi:hypothetical protein
LDVREAPEKTFLQIKVGKGTHQNMFSQKPDFFVANDCAAKDLDITMSPVDPDSYNIVGWLYHFLGRGETDASHLI